MDWVSFDYLEEETSKPSISGSGKQQMVFFGSGSIVLVICFAQANAALCLYFFTVHIWARDRPSQIVTTKEATLGSKLERSDNPDPNTSEQITFSYAGGITAVLSTL